MAEKINDCAVTKKELFCIGYNIPDLKIENKAFSSAVYFDNSKIYDNATIKESSFQLASFTNTKFNCKEVDISSNTFKGRTNFSKAEISADDVRFTNTLFEAEELSFRQSRIKAKSIDFSNCKFHTKSTDFSDAVLLADARAIIFTSCTFDGQTNFTNATLSAKDLVLFLGVNFTGSLISFGGTKFLNRGVTFSDAQFSDPLGVVGFPDALFNCLEVSFYKAKFSHEAQFTRTVFKVGKEIDFTLTHFFGKCNFNGSSFAGGRALFIRTKFKDELTFRETVFTSVIFDSVEFSNVDFTSSQFTSKAEFTHCNFPGNILFNYVEFKEPDKVFLQTADLSNWSFINTDVQE